MSTSQHARQPASVEIEQETGPGAADRSYQWVLAFLAAFLLMLSLVNLAVYGVFFKPIETEFGWSRTAISGGYTMRMAGQALSVLAWGWAVDRFSPRRILIPSMLSLGIGFVLMGAWTNSLWQLYALQGLLIGAGAAAPFACLSATVARWHTTRRGLALGIAAAGSAFGAILFPPLASQLIESYGWRHAAEFLGVAIIVLGVAIIVLGVAGSLLVRAPPVQDSAPSRNGENGVPARSGWRSLWTVCRRDRIILRILALFLSFNLAATMVQVHLVNYATDVGMASLIAALAMSAMGISSATGRLVFGAVADRTGSRAALVFCFSSCVVGLLFLSQSWFPGFIWIGVLFFGLGWGGEVPQISGLISEMYGTRGLGMHKPDGGGNLAWRSDRSLVGWGGVRRHSLIPVGLHRWFVVRGPCPGAGVEASSPPGAFQAGHGSTVIKYASRKDI